MQKMETTGSGQLRKPVPMHSNARYPILATGRLPNRSVQCIRHFLYLRAGATVSTPQLYNPL